MAVSRSNGIFLAFGTQVLDSGVIVSVRLLPARILRRYRVEERRHAIAIFKSDFPSEFRDLMECLDQFELLRSEIQAGGGGKTRIANRFDSFLKDASRGWTEQKLKVSRQVGTKTVESQTHKVDLAKCRIAVEVEWNNKDPFFSRDLGTFRCFHELDEISVGVIITRTDELQPIFDSLGYAQDKNGKWQRIGGKYGASTTHWGKLMPRVEAGEAGTCPLLLIGIKPECYRDDNPALPIVTAPP
jgi:hypothetical protein